MLGANAVVIESGRRNTPRFLVLFVIGLLLVSVVVLYRSSRPEQTKIHVAGEQFITEVASTPMAHQRGLSGRDSLAQNHAMLFTFETEGTQCFWMQDMRFNIDMVWLDGQNRIAAIEQNVAPGSYPKNFCHEGKSVIEFTEGTTERLHLNIGDQADL